MKKIRPTYQELESRLAAAEPIIAALRRHEVDAVVGEEKIAFLLLRKIEEACLESNGEFSAMFDLDGVGIIQANSPAFRFTRVNEKFCEMLGYTAEELLTRTYLDLTHRLDRRRDLKDVSRVVRGKADSWSIEKRCVRKDGQTIWVSVHGAARRDQDGRAVMIMAVIEDITARKQAELRHRDARAVLETQLRELRADFSRLIRSLRDQLGKRKPAEQVLAAVRRLVERALGPRNDNSLSRADEILPRRKAVAKKKQKSAGRRSTGKPRRAKR